MKTLPSVLMYGGSVWLNIKAYLTKDNVTFVLGSVCTVVVITYHVIRINKELKNKTSNGSNQGNS